MAIYARYPANQLGDGRGQQRVRIERTARRCELLPFADEADAIQLPNAGGRDRCQPSLADSGYFSKANVKLCRDAGIAPLIATGRKSHHLSLAERFAAVARRPIR